MKKQETFLLGFSKEAIISFMFFLPAINYFCALSISSFGIPSSILSNIVYSVLYCTGGFIYFKTCNNIKVLSLLYFISLLLFYSFFMNDRLLTLFSVDDPYKYITELLIHLPVFFLLINKFSLESLKETMIQYSIITITVSTLCFILLIFKNIYQDYMTSSYFLLFPCALCVSEKKTYIRALGFIALATILYLGCRGATIIILLYLTINDMFYIKDNSWHFNVKLFLVCLIIAFFLLNEIRGSSFFLDEHQLYSRQSQLLNREESSYFYSESRSLIFEEALNNLEVFGKGLFADRTLDSDVKMFSAYVHNFYLEILIDFGLFIGVAIILLFIYFIFSILKAIFKAHDSTFFSFGLITILVLLIKFAVSSSFLTSTDFLFCLGCGIHIICNSKNPYNMSDGNSVSLQKSLQNPF